MSSVVAIDFLKLHFFLKIDRERETAYLIAFNFQKKSIKTTFNIRNKRTHYEYIRTLREESLRPLCTMSFYRIKQLHLNMDKLWDFPSDTGKKSHKKFRGESYFDSFSYCYLCTVDKIQSITENTWLT